MSRHHYRRRNPLTSLLLNGRTYLVLAAGFGGYCAWSSTQEVMPGWHVIFGEPSMSDTIIVGVVSFIVALLALRVVRSLFRYFLT